MIESDICESVALFLDMLVYDFDDLAQRQDRHSVRIIFDYREVDASENLMITCLSPADRGKALDADSSNVI